MENKQELFKHHLAVRHPSEFKMMAKELCSKYSMLHETLSSIVDHNGKENLKYFSELFLETEPIVSKITSYVVNNGYSGLRQRVDDYVYIMQNILGNLKVLHLRYQSLTEVPKRSDHLEWWVYSQKGNKEILYDIRNLIESF